ncbi:MAG: FAD-dependent oxidoreductase [Pirellulales bacterium]
MRFRLRFHAVAFCLLIGISAFACSAHAAGEVALDKTYDVVVYGGTSGGVIAAVQTVKLGKSVLLIEPGEHLGGLSSGGLGATDIGNKAVIGGLSRDFYHRIWNHYQKPEAWKQETSEQYLSKRKQPGEETMWTFEPHVAEAIMDGYVADHKIPLLRKARLDLKRKPTMERGRLQVVFLEDGRAVRGKVFIDAGYEGDLLKVAGCSYHVGREANATYHETLNGVQVKHAVSHQFNKPVSAYVVPGDKSSGLLPGVHGDSPGVEGAGDKRVQAYNFRLALTDKKENQIPFPKPEGYDPLRYEILLRYINAGTFDCLQIGNMMPNRKTDTNNNGAFSSDNIGMNYEFPDADYATRKKSSKNTFTTTKGSSGSWPTIPECRSACGMS